MTARTKSALTVTYVGGPLDGRIEVVPTNHTEAAGRRLGYHVVTVDDELDGLAVWVGDDPSAVAIVTSRTVIDAEHFRGGIPTARVLGYAVCRLIEDAVRQGAHPASLTVRVRPGEFGHVAEVRGYKPAPAPRCSFCAEVRDDLSTSEDVAICADCTGEASR